jgi:hypothetical protein
LDEQITSEDLELWERQEDDSSTAEVDNSEECTASLNCPKYMF